MSTDLPTLRKYQKTSFDVAYQEFNADIVIPETLEHIFSMGKDTNKDTDDTELLARIANRPFAEQIAKFEAEGLVPALGIQEVQGKQLSYLEGAKQVFVKYDAPKQRPATNSTALF